MRLPDFIIIGAMKAGTTTLYRDLLTNPAVFMPIHKEPESLLSDDVLTSKGKAEYAALFDGAKADQICGEASTSYTKLPHFCGASERARELIGAKLKVIYLLREPVARIISHHYHIHTIGEFGPDINIEVRRCPRLLDYSRYAMQAEPWIEALGRESVLLMKFEDFVADRVGSARQVCDFLGIQPRLELIKPDAVYNRSDSKPVGAGFWRNVARWPLYRNVIRPVLPWSFQDRLRSLVLPKAPPRPAPPSAESVRFIREQLAEDQERLRVMMNRSEAVWPTQSTLTTEPG